MAKTFFKDGKWTESREIVVSHCKCGEKYIKTRKGQEACLRCLAAKRIG